MNAEELSSWFFNSLGSCGCGSPTGVFLMVQEILEGHAQDDRDSAEGKPWVFPSEGYRRKCAALPYIKKDGDDPEKWEEHPAYWMVLYWLNHIELLEHGGSVRSGWLTGKGQEVLEAMREFGPKFLELE
jgi:hypothetical protein